MPRQSDSLKDCRTLYSLQTARRETHTTAEVHSGDSHNFHTCGPARSALSYHQPCSLLPCPYQPSIIQHLLFVAFFGSILYSLLYACIRNDDASVLDRVAYCDHLNDPPATFHHHHTFVQFCRHSLCLCRQAAYLESWLHGLA